MTKLAADAATQEKVRGGGIQALFRQHLNESLAKYYLTDREFAVVLELVSGKTYAGIAEGLFITERTVKFHCQNIYGKLGVSNRREFMQLIDELL